MGELRGSRGVFDSLFFSLLLKPQIEDTEVQEQIVRASGVDWVLVQPVHLIDSKKARVPFLSTNGQTRSLAITAELTVEVFFQPLV